MSTLRYELIYATINRADTLIDVNIYNDIHKHFEIKKQTVLTDKFLTNDEKTYAIRFLTKDYDRDKVMDNVGTKRICENCNQECLATLYCDHCIRNYLKKNFTNWTSGNDDIDNLIQKCQMEVLAPNMIVEWIPYSNLKNIKYLIKDEFSEIYTADWIGGIYDEWDSNKKQLKRIERPEIQSPLVKVVLKKLINVKSASKSWFEEAKSYLTISNKRTEIVRCYGLTQNPLNENYMLVMAKMDIDLRKYLQQNHEKVTWKERIKIAYEIVLTLCYIHKEKVIHRDLHSGNILYLQLNDYWYIGDLGFYGPADKPSKSIYGNLPYIAPEVLIGGEYTFASDIYSIAILMWEISSGQPPFINYEHDNDLAVNIINGIRPKIVPETPLEYKDLMKECWDSDPSKRPDAFTLLKKIEKINFDYQNMSDGLFQSESDNLEISKASNLETNYTSSRLFTSKIHNFENLPEPRNATEEEQEEFHNKSNDSSIPDDINDLDGSNKQNGRRSSKVVNIFRAGSRRLSKVFKKLQINSNDDEKEIIQKEQDINIDGR
ncbi:kinase-like domain-containing protein [Rhizophagus irregularis DAOM 181602=DAOM 197198]|uniref:Kinase-like domain-containing protein n=1 Tax=Rhizophagus irregularis (strain DAOM 181602 / DAOM 197198 / MUCL 43194) TaxID=747089 RepID=A0A2P4P8C0_RHIID|nr:kinase-like domain-containing protein [Rhizophagus irregularis DAOM 181602=DAOM 197198]POG61624.1 kinase-like domain-containing protein [Rhizophagus irregularis DAOM 181602=DAOM 197198]|eukprot:XP_025168490.1 kinase-like domain-containing protein [Rhizophagus irregularis DAOM 181602=DAOM 197198]